MNPPKISRVSTFSWLRIGVPVRRLASHGIVIIRPDRLTGEPRRLAQLVLKVGTVGDRYHLEAVEPRHHAHLAHEEDHAEALTGPLCVPDDAAALIAGSALGASAAFLQASDSLVDGAELLVACHYLMGFAVHLPKDREAVDEVEQVSRAQHAGHEDLLALQRGARAAQRCRPLLHRAEEERRACALRLL
jgi:hypothetical protein